MFAYWTLLAYFAAGALLIAHDSGRNRIPSRALFNGGALLVVVLIGFRYEVGGDWDTYAAWFKYAGHRPLDRLLEIRDPAYQLLNWAVQQIGAGLWLVNLLCGAIFMWGLRRLCLLQPDPWLAMVIAVPYLVIVVAMGYTRQAVAIGILMAGVASLMRGASMMRFLLYVAIASAFHRTAMIAIPLVVLAVNRNRFMNFGAAGIAAYVLYDSFLRDSMEVLVRNYIVAEYSSQGALIRILMNFLPAIIFTIWGRWLGFYETERRIWRNYSAVALSLPLILLISPSSTAVDRLGLYITPLQIAVWNRVPGSLMKPGFGKLVVCIYSTAVLFIWMFFASHSEHWIPYRLFPL